MNEREHHTIADGPYTENIEVQWTGEEFVSLTQIPAGSGSAPQPVTVHVSMGQLHALGMEATKRLALRHLPPDAVPLPVEDGEEDDEAYADRS